MQAQQFNLDNTRFAVGGNSSGGNLATLTVNQARHDADLNISQQLLICPRVDSSLTLSKSAEFAVYQQEDIMLPLADQAYFQQISLPENIDFKDPRVSPYYAQLDGLPDTLIIVGEYDALRADSEFYARRLVENKVAVEEIVVPGQVHNAMTCRKVLTDGPDQAELAGEWLKGKFLL